MPAKDEQEVELRFPLQSFILEDGYVDLFRGAEKMVGGKKQSISILN